MRADSAGDGLLQGGAVQAQRHLDLVAGITQQGQAGWGDLLGDEDQGHLRPRRASPGG